MTTPSFSATTDTGTRELLLESTNALARQLADELRAGAPDAARLDTVKRDLRTAADMLAHGHTPAAADQRRALCDALHLFAACPRSACRRAQACRGRAETCLAHADVPDAVFDHAMALMLAQLVPAAALFTGRRADARLAYEAWVAAMTARR